jgi:prepilin-type processing-associated H-X9-DG protein
MKTTIQYTVLLALTLAGGASSSAEEKSDPASRAKAIAPLFDEQTVAVVRADLARVNVDAIAAALLDLVPDAQQDIDHAKGKAARWIAAFTQAGGRELYGVFSLADLGTRDWLPIMVVPLGEKADPAALGRLFPRPYQVKQLSCTLVAATPDALKRLDSQKPDERPEMTAAFEAAGDAAVQVLLLPPKYSRRVIEEVMPQLPGEVGGGPSTIVTRGVRWAALAVDLPPQPALRLVIQSDDAPAAEALLGKWSDVLRLASEREEIRRLAPKSEEAIPLLTPARHGDRLVVALDAKTPGMDALATPVVKSIRQARKSTWRAQSMNNLKQIGLAMHNYHDSTKHFPAAASYDTQGRPLLSWRVHVLPYLEQEALYKQFHLDEPWDSPHNRTLIERMPEVYRSPASKLKEKDRTCYVVPVGLQTVFPGREGMQIKDIKDGASNTILAVEVDDSHAVPWTKPEDLPFDLQQPAKGLGGLYEGGFNALFGDGHVQFLALPRPAEQLRALFTPRGGERVNP